MARKKKPASGPSYSALAMRRAANARVDLATRPQLNSIDAERRTQVRMGADTQRRMGVANEALLGPQGALARSLTAAKDSSADSAARTSGVAQEARTRLGQSAADAAARMGQDQAVRGPGLDGGSGQQLATAMAQAQGRVETDANAYKSAGVAKGAGYEGLIAAAMASQGQRAQEQGAQLANTQAKTLGALSLKREDIVGSRGPMRDQLLYDMNQQAFNNEATLRGLGIKEQSEANDFLLGQLSNQLGYEKLDSAEGIAQMRDNTTQRGQNIASADRADANANRLAIAQVRAGKKGVGGLTPFQRMKLREQNDEKRGRVEKMVDLIGELEKATGDDGKRLTSRQIRIRLAEKYKDKDLVNTAYDLAKRPDGTISPANIRALERKGITVPKKWRTPRKQKGLPALGDISDFLGLPKG